MDNKAEQTTDYDRMVSVLQQFRPAETRRSPRKIETIFNQVLKTARTSDKWLDKETDRVVYVAGMIFVDADDATQAMTFAFMKTLINVFRNERHETINGSKNTVITKLFRLYFSVVLLYSNKPSLLTKASQHAEECISDAQLDRSVVLGAFEMYSFVDYPIERFEKKAVKSLLIIAKEKMLYHTAQDLLMPNTLRFVEKVCVNQESCGVVIRVCHVLKDLFRSIASREAFQEFDMLEGSPVFHWIMVHVAPSRLNKKCWLAVAEFIKSTLLFADLATKRILVGLGAFPRINDMLRDGGKKVIVELLDAVRAASEDFQLIYYLVTANIHLRILPMVADGFASIEIRMQACEAFSQFLKNAPPYEVYRASENGVVAALVKLLKSRHTLAVEKALNWINEMIYEGQPHSMRKGYASMFIAAGADEILRRKDVHPNAAIRNLAHEILGKLHCIPTESSTEVKSEKEAS